MTRRINRPLRQRLLGWVGLHFIPSPLRDGAVDALVGIVLASAATDLGWVGHGCGSPPLASWSSRVRAISRAFAAVSAHASVLNLPGRMSLIESQSCHTRSNASRWL